MSDTTPTPKKQACTSEELFKQLGQVIDLSDCVRRFSLVLEAGKLALVRIECCVPGDTAEAWRDCLGQYELHEKD